MSSFPFPNDEIHFSGAGSVRFLFLVASCSLLVSIASIRLGAKRSCGSTFGVAPWVAWRRQHPFGVYILDFVCLSHMLIVEVDGAGHDEERDAVRDEFLARSGFRVLRVKAWMVERHISVVLEVIAAALGE